MRFQVTYSDDAYDYYDAEDARAAYKLGGRNAVGRYISSIKCYDFGRIYYKSNEGFIDPDEGFIKKLDEVTTADLIQGVFPALNDRDTVIALFNESAYMSSRQIDDETFECTLKSYIGHRKVLKKLKIKLSVSVDIPVKHDFSGEGRTCVTCGQGVFDVENPTGDCAG